MKWMAGLVALASACAGAPMAVQTSSYAVAQDACITNAAALDASAGEKKAAADTCRCDVKKAWGRSCDGGAP